MKNVTKNFIFSGFDSTISKEATKSKLSLSCAKNFLVDGNIKSTSGYDDFLKKLFGEEKYEAFLLQNPDVADKLIYLTTFYFNGEFKKLFLTQDFALYQLDETSMALSLINQFSSMPYFSGYNGTLFVFDGSSDLFLFDETGMTRYDSINSKITDMTIDKNIMYFLTNTSDYNAFFAAERSFKELLIDMENYSSFPLDKAKGKVLKVCSYKNTVYIFQQYGISYVTTVSKTKKFLYRVHLSSAILPNTIYQINNYFVFLTESGFYSFNGTRCSKIFSELGSHVMGAKKAVAFMGNYYLLADTDFDGENSKSLLMLNAENNLEAVIDAKNISDIFTFSGNSVNELVLVLNDAETSSLLCFGDGTNEDDRQYLKFNKFYPNDGKGAILSKLKICCKGKFKLKITSDLGSVVLNVNNNSMFRNIGLRGKAFEIEIFGNGLIEIETILIETITNYKKA